MKNLFRKNLTKALAAVLASSGCVAFTPVTSCSKTNSIQLANFESYMDDDLMEYLSDKFDVHYQWYTVTEMIETKFDKFYDIAIPSGYELVTLYKKGLLEKIQWDKFAISDMDGNPIKNSNDAHKLFANEVDNQIVAMNQQFNEYLKVDNFEILDYGIPYFAQQFMFAYKGNKIENWPSVNGGTTKNPTWQDIFYTVSPANTQIDSEEFKRFKPTNTPTITMLDDAKSIYDIARIIETGSQQGWDEATNLMPTEDYHSKEALNTLGYISNFFANKGKGSWFTLLTDSGQISRLLAAGEDKHGYHGGFCWSGDTVYGATGAEEFNSWSGDKFHIQKPAKASLDEIEFIVINNKNDNDQQKLDKIYDVVKTIALDGCDKSKEQIHEKVNSSNNYKYWSMQNWNTIMYTPVLKNIYEYVTDEQTTYWNQYMNESWTDEIKNQTKQMYIDMIKPAIAEYAKSNFGKTLKPIQNSDIHWAWNETKPKF